MSTQLVKGANASLSDASPLLRAIEVILSWSAEAEAQVTVALLGADHRLAGDDYVLPAHLLGGQERPLSRGGEVFEIDLTAVPSHLTAMAFLVSVPDLAKPDLANSDLAKPGLADSALADPEQPSLMRLDPAQVRVSDAVTAVELARYDLETPSPAETSLVLAEVYLRGGQWKVRAVGQGSDGGLTAVLRTYGGTDLPTSGPPATWLDTSFLRRRSTTPAAALSSSRRPQEPASGEERRGSAARVSLEKAPLETGDVPTTDVMARTAAATMGARQPDDLQISGSQTDGQPSGWRTPELLTAPVALSARTILNDRRPSIRVAPQQVGGGELAVTLTWVRPTSGQPRSPSQLPGRGQPQRPAQQRPAQQRPAQQRPAQQRPADPSADRQSSTDLHLGALWQLSSGLSGALQSLGGHRRGPVRGEAILRLGPHSEAEGETVTIDLQRLPDLHRVILFVYAYSGRPQWRLLRPAITATWANGAKVEARIDDAPPVATICAAVSIHRVGQTMVLRREAEFLRGQQSAVATAYGFDLGWSRGQVMPGR